MGDLEGRVGGAAHRVLCRIRDAHYSPERHVHQPVEAQEERNFSWGVVGHLPVFFSFPFNEINLYSDLSFRVLCQANPANTNALICSKYAPSIPKKNFTAMTRLDQTRALSQIAGKAKCDVEDIENIIVWGNHSATQYPDTFHATIKGKALREVINDDEYLNGPFISKVAKRGAEIISVMKKSSAASAAAAACEHMHDWWYGNQQGGYVSMGVMPEESHYGITNEICYSYHAKLIRTVTGRLLMDSLSTNFRPTR